MTFFIEEDLCGTRLTLKSRCKVYVMSNGGKSAQLEGCDSSYGFRDLVDADSNLKRLKP